jgi:hypothetical protein
MAREKKGTVTGADLTPKTRGKKGSLTGSARVSENTTPSTALEGLSALGEKVAAVGSSISDKVQAVGNGVSKVTPIVSNIANNIHSAATVLNRQSTNLHGTDFSTATNIASGLGVSEFDLGSALGTNPYDADSDIPEMTSSEANAKRLRIQRQMNSLEVRHDKTKLQRKVLQVHKEHVGLVGDAVDVINEQEKVIGKVIDLNQTLVANDTKRSKLDELSELHLQQDVRTQGVRNLTPGLRDEWQLKLQLQATKNEGLKIAIEGADATNQQKRAELEARLLDF